MNKYCTYILLMIFFVSCGEQRKNYTGGALGTSYSIISISNNNTDLTQEIDSVFKVVNSSLSTYIPESDISRINKGDSTIVVDDMFMEVFNMSKIIYDDTNGFFDPTVGTLVNAWGFGPERQVSLDSTKVDSLLNFVGFSKVSLTPNKRIQKASPEIYIDFNAIAKGYAIDRLGVLMNENGIENYLIELGGEIITKGKNTIKKKSWVVGIDDPQIEVGRNNKLLIQLENKALASSGNYRKFRVDEETGTKYVHTINPKTGYTQNSNTLAVTILADNCATADAYATAFMAMELDKAFKLILNHEDLEAYIIYIDENGETQEFLTKGFEEIVVN